jgi:hypothetical protein
MSNRVFTACFLPHTARQVDHGRRASSTLRNVVGSTLARSSDQLALFAVASG